MALVCQKITRINTYFKKVFLDCLNFELPKLELSHAAHVLRNIKLSRLEDLNKFKVLELEKFLLKQIEEKINSKENFGNDSMVNLFKCR